MIELNANPNNGCDVNDLDWQIVDGELTINVDSNLTKLGVRRD